MTTIVNAASPREERLAAGESSGADRSLVPGSFVDRYVIEEQLGRGGMGVVYRAHDPQLDRDLALKLMRVHAVPRGRSPLRSARLLREAQALARLSHPNVVAVFDIGTWGEQLFLAMELATGATFKEWLRKQAPSRRRVLDVLLAVGQGLAAAHKAGLVHRDVKPSNIVIGEDDRVRVIDFGLARAGEAMPPRELEPSWLGGEAPRVQLSQAQTARQRDEVDPSPANLLRTPVTQAGTVAGTPRYMAPEQHLGAAVDARADQFSFSVVLYEALCGRHPFGKLRGSQLVTAKLTGSIEPPAPGRGLSGELKQAVLRGLSARPVDRFPSITDLLAYLICYAEGGAAQRAWLKEPVWQAQGWQHSAGRPGSLAGLNPWMHGQGCQRTAARDARGSPACFRRASLPT